MTKRVRAAGQAHKHARYSITGGCDTDKNFIVAAIYNAHTGSLEAREFHQHKSDALRAAEWFKSHQVELVIIESTANYHLLYYDTLREQGINIAVINPMVIKSLLRVEGKSDKSDAMTLARLAASFDLKTSNMPDSQQRELRLLFKRVDAWKTHRTQTTNRANSILTAHSFTVFRLVPINSGAGLKIIQAIIDRRTPTEIAALHRNQRKRPEIEKCANVELPAYLLEYLQEVQSDVKMLNQRIDSGEQDILDKVDAFNLREQIDQMCTVPGVSRMLAMRIIAEMGANYHQRYYTAEAFSKAIGVVPNNEVSGGKIIKRKASHGNARVKFHLLSAVKAYAIHGHGPLHDWYNSYRKRTNYMKAISAMARRISEGLWWVLVREEPYKHWNGALPEEEALPQKTHSYNVDETTGELLGSIEDELDQPSNILL